MKILYIGLTIALLFALMLTPFVGLGRCDPILSGDISFSFRPTMSQLNDQCYMGAYMTTGRLGYNISGDDYISATAIKVTTSFCGTNKTVFSSNDALAMGIAGQGPDGLDRGLVAWDWGYLLLLVLDGKHDDPYIQGMVWKVWEWGYNGTYPLEPAAADDVSHWTWRYPGVLTISSNVTLIMTWTPNTLEYGANIDGTQYPLYSYTPELTARHYFKLGLYARQPRWPAPIGTVKWLQFPGAWCADDTGGPARGWITHLSSPSMTMSGEMTWTNVNFSYSVDGSQSFLDHTMPWGALAFPNVAAHYCFEPWSLPDSEPINQVFFYPNGTYTLPIDTRLWSVEPVNFAIENLVPLEPDYVTVQVYHGGMRLNGNSVSKVYALTIARTDSTDATIVWANAGIKRTNMQNASDFRVINTTTIALALGGKTTLNLTWQETDTMTAATWEISGFASLNANKIYWDTNPADNEVKNDTVVAAELIGDINGNGLVEIYDAIQLAGAFNSRQGQWRYAADADLNHDGIIDIYDAIIFASHYNQYIGNPGGRAQQMYSEIRSLFTETVLQINPCQTVVFTGEVFNVTVNIACVTDLLGWEFKLYWNNTILNCTSAVLNSPVQWQGYTQDYGTGLENAYNATNGRFFKAETPSYPAQSFSGSTIIVTLTFQAMHPGTTSLMLTETKLGNSTAQPIEHTALSGSVTAYYGRYLRSDTQSINGLSAYKLDVPQSTSPMINTRSGSGGGAVWGIRAWVRHSNGVEQEVTLDGQTGTPKATVFGGSAGIRSNTVSVSQTSLQSTDSLIVRVYVKVAEGSWNLCASFTTEQLGKSSLLSTTWTVNYYTYSTYNRIYDLTTAKFYWGTTNCNSRIQNVQFS